ncbi:MAG: tRNA (adenosine(37)-N6)-dimethylallyltransferase MiaA [Chitinophagaceae bacterium]|nr:tRNA (adenosine(37)-N6)-dimethylallyltransferase MiaA [Chitinophagaceae bacterium]
MSNNTVYIIVGPTAVGKTSFAISLAQHLKTEIISADARQCYAELNIGVARPSLEELSKVPHHFIASHSVNDTINAQVFENYALAKTDEIFKTHHSVVMVGGTGLYIKAFCEGLDMIPDIDPAIRAHIIAQYDKLGLRWLQKEVSVKDPLYWAKGEQQNPQRLMRALEVILGTGTSIVSFQIKNKIMRPFNIVKVGLELPREQLYERINQRVISMVENGLEKEVRDLVPQYHLNALQTVGYSEWGPYFEGSLSKEKVIENIQQNTRHYAKRQMTWFKKDLDITWYSPNEIKAAQIV